MKVQERDYDDVLRRALSAAAESVEPAADGLERIRGRVSGRHVSPFMLLSELVEYWFRQLPQWLESGAGGARSALRRLGARTGPAARRSQPAPTGWRARLRPAFTRLGPAASWLKPVLAVGGAVGIVVAGVFTLGQVQQAITPTNQISRPNAPHHKPSPPVSAVAVTPSPPATSAPAAYVPSAAATTCPPSPKASTTPSKITITPTPTPTATPTPTVSSTPTPTPSYSDTYPSVHQTHGGTAGTVKLLLSCSSALATGAPAKAS
jgi:hypothetical protein